jgi:hypothetical protein
VWDRIQELLNLNSKRFSVKADAARRRAAIEELYTDVIWINAHSGQRQYPI